MTPGPMSDSYGGPDGRLSGDTVDADRNAMRAIQQAMDGTEWNADTLCAIADILREAGYRVSDLEGQTNDLPRPRT